MKKRRTVSTPRSSFHTLLEMFLRLPPIVGLSIEFGLLVLITNHTAMTDLINLLTLLKQLL
jgi:hypothetical protein